MINNFSKLLVLALISVSCNVVKSPSRTQTSDEYIASLDSKWKKFAERIGVKGTPAKSAALIKQEVGTFSSLTGIQLGPDGKLASADPKVWQKNLTELVDAHWDKDLVSDEFRGSNLMASDFKVIGEGEDKGICDLYTLEYKSGGHTNYAYISFPKNDILDFPLAFLHKDDRGLSWGLMKNSLGRDILSRKFVIAPAGPGEALIKQYKANTAPEEDNILHQSSHTGALAWGDDVDDVISLIRGLFYTEQEDESFAPISILKGIGEFSAIDFVGTSKGGLTAALAVAKLGYINKPFLLNFLGEMNTAKKAYAAAEESFKENPTELAKAKKAHKKALKKAEDDFVEKKKDQKLLFANKLVTVGAPLTFSHGSFRLIVKDCITGAIKGSKYENYPGLRTLLPLFDDFRNAKEGSEEESTALDTLVGEALTRDFTFLLPYVAGGMPSLYFKGLAAEFPPFATVIKPRLAFLHHKKDKMIPVDSNMFAQGLFASTEFSDILGKSFAMKYDIVESNIFNTKGERPSVKFHLEFPFWGSLNEDHERPREVINYVLDSASEFPVKEKAEAETAQ